jgi:iron complex transport system ATP-binding protein
METMLRLAHGAFSYGDHMIFRELDLELALGDVLCLLGPNGCGKTTLLRCLNGLLPVRKGTIWLRGRELDTLDERDRARVMGFVFQEHSSPFPYSVLETVVMGRAPHLAFLASPAPRDLEMAEQALVTVGMHHLRDQRYTEISGGERQLVLIARALAQEPALLLLDEPTSHLDYGHQMLVLQTIHRLAVERRLTVIMATHFPDHALLIANRVAMMKEGRFMAVGAPGEVVTEGNLERLYGVPVRIVAIEEDGSGGGRRAVVPLLYKPLGPGSIAERQESCPR